MMTSVLFSRGTAMKNNKPHSYSRNGLPAAGLALFLLSPVSQAQIYKWVDEQGRTHYSERKEDAGKAKVVDLRVTRQPVAAPSKSSPERAIRAQDEVRMNYVPGPKKQDYTPPEPAPPKSLSGGRADDTDASRCNLARDVVSGAVQHPNGAPIDAYDRQIAENDIRAFCR